MSGWLKTRWRNQSALDTLTRNFLRRFFDNEITGGTTDLASIFFWFIGFVGGPFALMPVPAIVRYRAIVSRFGPDALRVISRADKVLVIQLGMVVSAIVAAVAWNSLMLDRRDGLILGSLPIRGRTVVAAKIVALAIYVLSVAAAMHAIPSVGYGLILSDRTHSLRVAILGPVAHFVATTSACAFVFLLITATQGVALASLGPRAFRRLSPLLQAALVGGVIVAATKISTVEAAVAQMSHAGQAFMPSRWLWWAPPMWFLGLYEWILGSAGSLYSTLGAIAVVALTGTAALAASSYFVVYSRLMAQVVETPDDAVASHWLSAVVDWTTRTMSDRQVARASIQFFFASVGRVERLRFVVAVTMGVLCAWIAPALLLWNSTAESKRGIFSLSYLALAVLVTGLRITVSLPADLRAAWMIPLIDAPARWLRAGLWRALFLTGVIPVVLAFSILGVQRWPWNEALAHACVLLALGTALVEISLWHFDAISNSRPWRPEGANLRLRWPLYLLGFIGVTVVLPQLEWLAKDSIAGTAAVICGLLLTAYGVRRAHSQPYPVPSFEIETFVEPPHVLGLD